MNGIMKIVQVLKDSHILLKGVAKTIQNESKEQKEQKVGFLSIFFMCFRSTVISKFINRKRSCKSWRRNNKSWVWYFNQKKALIPPHSLTNFEMKEYYDNEPRFHGVILEIICLKQ